MKSEADKLLARHPGLVHSELQKVTSHVQRRSGEWIINTLMLDLYDDPGFVRDLFDFVVEMELQYARAQIDAGAEIIGIGESLAGRLLMYDGLATSFYELKLAWNPNNPLNGNR